MTNKKSYKQKLVAFFMNSVQGGFVGGSLRLHATEIRASIDMKFRGAGGRESEFIGRAGVSYNF